MVGVFNKWSAPNTRSRKLLNLALLQHKQTFPKKNQFDKTVQVEINKNDQNNKGAENCKSFVNLNTIKFIENTEDSYATSSTYLNPQKISESTEFFDIVPDVEMNENNEVDGNYSKCIDINTDYFPPPLFPSRRSNDTDTLPSLSDTNLNLDAECPSPIASEENDTNDVDWQPDKSKESNSDLNSTNKTNTPTSESVVEFVKSKNYKQTYCCYCDTFQISKHFTRHLKSKHMGEKLVKHYFDSNVKKEKQMLITSIRNRGNFNISLKGKIIPKKILKTSNKLHNLENYGVCTKCKTFLRLTYLRRHSKKCLFKTDDSNEANCAIESFVVCNLDESYRNYLTSLPFFNEIVKKLRADEIGKLVISDAVIMNYGIDLLKTDKNIKKRSIVVRNKMRECGRILKEMKKLDPEVKTFVDILKPEKFDLIIAAVKAACQYDAKEKTYQAASFALHQGKTIKDLIDLLICMTIKRDKIINCTNPERFIKELKLLKRVIEAKFAKEIGSLALKDLTEKKSKNNEKKLIPFTEDIIKLRKYCVEKADEAYQLLKECRDPKAFSILVEVTFVLILVHNRKRVGDIQFIKTESFCQSAEIQQNEFVGSLSESERQLTKFYKKINTLGKGSRIITVLIPKDVCKYTNMLLKQRQNFILPSNPWFFSYPNSDDWLQGCTTMRKYAYKCGAREPKLLTSCRLRKHIATISMLTNLSDSEVTQLATFMGHTVKTHKEFYRLPQDVLMIAKVSKLLLKLDKGEILDCKNKNLEEIDVNLEEVVEDSDNSDDEEVENPPRFAIDIPHTEAIEEDFEEEEIVRSVKSKKEALVDSKKSNKVETVKKVRKAKKRNILVEENLEVEDLENTEVKRRNVKSKSSKILKQTNNVRIKWTARELSLIEKTFQIDKDYPNSEEIKMFLTTNKINRTVQHVKSKIQHLRRLRGL